MSSMKTDDIDAGADVCVAAELRADQIAASIPSRADDDDTRPGYGRSLLNARRRKSSQSTILIVCHQCGHQRVLHRDVVVTGSWKRAIPLVCGHVRGALPQPTSATFTSRTTT